MSQYYQVEEILTEFVLATFEVLDDAVLHVREIEDLDRKHGVFAPNRYTIRYPERRMVACEVRTSQNRTRKLDATRLKLDTDRIASWFNISDYLKK